MEILLKNALIVDERSSHHGKRKDILISKGKIQSIAKKISSSKAKKIISDNLHVSLGWMDIGTHLGEPGFEQRETTTTVANAAMAGGYTALAPFPNTAPVIETPSDITYLKEHFKSFALNIHPIVALSIGTEGKELTEMRDLFHHGAIAYSDGLKGTSSAGLLLRAMQYIADLNVPVIDVPEDSSLAKGGQMHEGEMSVTLGLKGIPDIAESMQIQRDITLHSYTGGKLILHNISGEKACQIIADAQKYNDNIKATTPYINLIANHEKLTGFNVNYKVFPPIKEESDRSALFIAVKKGNIQAIVSNHRPLEVEKKMLEFPYATPGATGLETCFPAMNTYFKGKHIEVFIRALSIGPRQILHLPVPEIKTGEEVNLTLFDPDIEWTFNESFSLSKNNPFLGQQFTGKVIGTILGGKMNMNN